MLKRLLLVALFVLILAACQTNNPLPVASPTVEPAATDTPEPSATPSPSPSPLPPTETPTATPPPTNTPTPEPVGPSDFPEDVNPLTGQKVDDPAVLDRRPVSVKIQTFPRGQRPPWGVSQADIVYDYYQNNGLTRLFAVFYGSGAEQVGPIRSGRLLDAILMNMYESVFAFGGADQRILNQLTSYAFSNRLVFEGGHNCPPMCRVDPNSYNYLVTNTEELHQYAEEQGMSTGRPNLDGMRFDLNLPDGGKTGEQLFTHYSISAYNRWDYDPVSGRYLRFVDQQESNGTEEVYGPMTDRLNDQQVSAANVVVLMIPHTYFYRSNSGNSEIVDIQLRGSGKAYAFRDGQAYELTWLRPTPEELVYLTFPDGSPYEMKPGNTWFQVMGQTSPGGQQDDGSWRFEQSFP